MAIMLFIPVILHYITNNNLNFTSELLNICNVPEIIKKNCKKIILKIRFIDEN